MDTKIKKFLEKSKVKYETIEHRKVYTAFNAAETQHVKLNEVVKTVLVIMSKETTHILPDGNMSTVGAALVAVPAGKRVDLEKISKAINDSATKSYKILVKQNPKFKKPAQVQAKLAKEKYITAKLKTKVGLISPFSQIYELPLLFDKKLVKNKHLLVSAGSYTESIKIKTNDFIKLIIPVQGSFTE